MGYSAQPPQLRNLLGVAIKLRDLAEETLHAEDRRLYLVAAMALERRAEKMAAGLPDDPQDRETYLHQPVNMTV
jgi:hypothetical protein